MKTGRLPIPGSLFTKVKRRRVFEEICDQIRTKLARGEYRPGDKLPSERDLAVELGVGRPAVREALRTLENSGVVMLKKGLHGGAFVREGSPETVTQSLHDLMSLGHITLPALMEARRVIIGSVLRLACERGTLEEFDALDRTIGLIEQFDVGNQYQEKLQAGSDFFRLLAVAAHNSVLMLLTDSLTMIVRYVAATVRPGNNPLTDPLRREIVACLRARDPAGAQVHLDRFFDTVEGEFRRVLARHDAALPTPTVLSPA
jgi:GntR family transcriptional repressor for pyruvate dehydrogenase complex